MARGEPPNGFELSCPAKAGRTPLLYVQPAGDSSIPEGPARRASRRPFVPDGLTGILVTFQGFSELLGGIESSYQAAVAEGQEEEGRGHEERDGNGDD